MQQHIRSLWGTPSAAERKFAATIESIPILRRLIPNPTMHARRVVNMTTSLWNAVLLDLNPASTAAQVVQTATTLAPHMTTAQYLGLVREALKPSTWRRLKKFGVVSGATKLESGATAGRTTAWSSISPFQNVSRWNRTVGYLAGEMFGRAQGMTGEQLHRNGLAWAEIAEFDNSKWNSAPVLRGNRGRLFGQYQGFRLKSVENLLNMPRETGAQGTARALGTQMALGGIKSLGMPVEAAISYGYVVALTELLKDAGLKRDHAERAAEALWRGLPALLGMDFSGRVSWLDFYGKGVWGKIGRQMTGPTGNALVSAYENRAAVMPGYTAHERAKALVQVLKETSPWWRTGDTLLQLQKRGWGGLTADVKGKPVRLTPLQGALRMAGFSTLASAREYDRQELATQMRQRIANVAASRTLARTRTMESSDVVRKRVMGALAKDSVETLLAKQRRLKP
jgi:hypothetical protein